jgi:hypothetical protein
MKATGSIAPVGAAITVHPGARPGSAARVGMGSVPLRSGAPSSRRGPRWCAGGRGSGLRRRLRFVCRPVAARCAAQNPARPALSSTPADAEPGPREYLGSGVAPTAAGWPLPGGGTRAGRGASLHLRARRRPGGSRRRRFSGLDSRRSAQGLSWSPDGLAIAFTARVGAGAPARCWLLQLAARVAAGVNWRRACGPVHATPSLVLARTAAGSPFSARNRLQPAALFLIAPDGRRACGG